MSANSTGGAEAAILTFPGLIFSMTQAQAVRRGRRLGYFTIVWNCLEALVALAAGFPSGSVALIGFGFDSLIEVSSGGAALWRLRRGPASERLALRAIGVSFLLLAAYVLYESAESLLRHEAPERSATGIALAAVSVVVMPLLARAKRGVAAALGSATLAADARQTDFCTYLSAILLAGLALNAVAGLWWADPLAAAIMVPIIAREGAAALRGRGCGCH